MQLKYLILAFILIVLVLPASATTWSYPPGTKYWVAPAGVTNITVLIAGGGGSGHGGWTVLPLSYGAGGGGSAGEYQIINRIPVVVGTNYTLVIGAGGVNASYGLSSNPGTYSSAFGYSKAGGLGGEALTTGVATDGASTNFVNVTKRTFDGGTHSGLTAGVGGTGYGAGGGGGTADVTDQNTIGGFGAPGIVQIYTYGDFPGNVPGFTATPTTGGSGSLINFNDTSTINNATGLSYNWSFGDGSYSNTFGDVGHVYQYLGSYDVGLTMTYEGNISLTETKTGYINIISLPVIFDAPRTVSLICTNYNQRPLSGLTVIAEPINFTMPASWFQAYYGFDSSVNVQGQNLTGTTGSDGSWAAPLSSSVQYRFSFSGAGITAYNETFYPTGTSYFIRIPTAAIYTVPTPASDFITFTMANVTNDTTHDYYNVTYRDTSGGTSLLRLVVTHQNKTELYNGTVSGFGTGATAISSGLITHSTGDVITYRISGTQARIGFVNKTETVTYPPTGSTLSQFPAWVGNWMGIGLIVLLAGAFSVLSVRFALIIVPAITLFMMIYLRWLTPSVGTASAITALVLLFTLGVILYIRKAEPRQEM